MLQRIVAVQNCESLLTQGTLQPSAVALHAVCGCAVLHSACPSAPQAPLVPAAGQAEMYPNRVVPVAQQGSSAAALPIRGKDRATVEAVLPSFPPSMQGSGRGG